VWAIPPIKIWTFRNRYIGWKQRLLKKPKDDKFGEIGQPRPEDGGRKEKAILVLATK
jgi:hypothetical protein